MHTFICFYQASVLIQKHVKHLNVTLRKPTRPCKWVYSIILLLYTTFGVQYASFFNQLTFVSECCCKDITCKPCLVRSNQGVLFWKSLWIRVLEEAEQDQYSALVLKVINVFNCLLLCLWDVKEILRVCRTVCEY